MIDYFSRPFSKCKRPFHGAFVLSLVSFVMILGLLGSCDLTQTSRSRYNAVNMGVSGEKSASENQQMIQEAINKISEEGGGTLYFPPGIYKTGTIYLKDSVHIYLEAGATIRGSEKLSLYPQNDQDYHAYTERYTKKALLWAEGKTNIGIEGKGTVDGHGNSETLKDSANQHGLGDLPLGIRFISCKNVTIEDVNLRNGGLWMQHYLNCTNLTIHNVKVFNHHTSTNDGLNIDGCKNVRVSDCYIDSHDDAIALKSSGTSDCENITITNCVLRSHCHCIKFGTETIGGFKKININNCTVSPSDVSYKRADGSTHKPHVLTGVCLLITDGGTMKNIHISDIVADSVYAPFFIRYGNRGRKPHEGAPEAGPGKMQDIMISDFIATDAHYFGSSIAGYPDHYVKNVTFSNIDIRFDKTQDTIDRPYKVERPVPENAGGYPDIQMYGGYMPSYGFFIRHVKDIRFNNIELKYIGKEERPAFIVDDVHDMVVEGFDIQAPVKNAPVFDIQHSSNILLRNYTGFNEEKMRVNSRNCRNLVKDF